MKYIFVTAASFLASLLVSQVKPDWTVECGNYPLSTLVVHENKMYYSCESSFGSLTSEGKLGFLNSVDSVRVNNLRPNSSTLFMMAAHRLSRYAPSGIELDRTHFLLPNKEPVFSDKAEIFQNRVYM